MVCFVDTFHNFNISWKCVIPNNKYLYKYQVLVFLFYGMFSTVKLILILSSYLHTQADTFMNNVTTKLLEILFLNKILKNYTNF